MEERLVEFTGTILLVSHDREFLNNVVTSTIVFEEGGAREYVGGYDDWLRQRAEGEESTSEKVSSTKSPAKMSGGELPAAKRRLAYGEKRDLELLPAKIEKLESEIARLHDEMAQPEYYNQPASELAHVQEKLKQLSEQLTAAYKRWEELELLAD